MGTPSGVLGETKAPGSARGGGGGGGGGGDGEDGDGDGDDSGMEMSP